MAFRLGKAAWSDRCSMVSGGSVYIIELERRRRWASDMSPPARGKVRGMRREGILKVGLGDGGGDGDRIAGWLPGCWLLVIAGW